LDLYTKNFTSKNIIFIEPSPSNNLKNNSRLYASDFVRKFSG